jgi:hypothetical protein
MSHRREKASPLSCHPNGAGPSAPGTARSIKPCPFRGSFVRAWIAAWSSRLTLSPPSKEGEVVSLFGGQLVVGEQAAHVFCPQAVWFLIQCFVAEGVSPAPSREVVTKHTPEWS